MFAAFSLILNFPMISRPPYQGPHRKLVLAFDVGTTYSGISYSILDPGEVPQIRGVGTARVRPSGSKFKNFAPAGTDPNRTLGARAKSPKVLARCAKQS